MNAPTTHASTDAKRRPLLVAAFGFLTLGLICCLVYSGLFVLDFGVPASLADSPFGRFMDPGAVETMASFSEVIVGVLGIAITVVAIIVELAANRYTPRITELFLRDPINIAVLSSYVVISVLVIWIDMSLYGDTHPHSMVLASVTLMSLALLTILPYFSYVFDFLSPAGVIDHIRRSGTREIERIASGRGDLDRARTQLIHAIEQLGDIANNSVEQQDKPIALDCLTALAALANQHLATKSELPDAWFESASLVRSDQDFAALHPDMVRALSARKTWVEMKILRQYQSVFSASLHKLRDVNHLVGIHTRRIALAAMDHGDEHSAQLSIRFLNTYLRATINGRDVRSAYNLLNEYRLLTEHALTTQRYDDLDMLADHFRFYGQLAFKSQLAFVLEIVAYDLCAVLEQAHAHHAPCHDALLTLFLDLDREPEGAGSQESSLRGVRKAQVKLATYYLVHDATGHARRIFEDMQSEKVDRLKSIRDELRSVKDVEYWEVVDRGINFDYLDDARRAQLATFFAWFPWSVG